ncbi:MAG: molybdopterin-guanine dinucleotide biosynthesis protein B [Planctomycetaceae bacterium]|nr:molybdopterin-guanine dinucleotide biosynthesis protein B [Planctomycetales bacterium]MCB9927417.1 molybdopterin-guanine dinucleotide biosynthesis protein B [Planctomycetaceae bacterium]
MKRIHIIGRKNSGKTTLIVDLVRELTSLGHHVGTIKHTHHHHELDTPGKDSHQHREAGARVVGILSPGMKAVFQPTDRGEAESTDRYDSLAPMYTGCKVVLVEGDLQTTARKIEVWRACVTKAPLASSDSTISAVVTDDDVSLSVPTWSRSDISRLAERLLEIAGLS